MSSEIKFANKTKTVCPEALLCMQIVGKLKLDFEKSFKYLNNGSKEKRERFRFSENVENENSCLNKVRQRGVVKICLFFVD